MGLCRYVGQTYVGNIKDDVPTYIIFSYIKDRISERRIGTSRRLPKDNNNAYSTAELILA